MTKKTWENESKKITSRTHGPQAEVDSNRVRLLERGRERKRKSPLRLKKTKIERDCCRESQLETKL